MPPSKYIRPTHSLPPPIPPLLQPGGFKGTHTFSTTVFVRFGSIFARRRTSGL